MNRHNPFAAPAEQKDGAEERTERLRSIALAVLPMTWLPVVPLLLVSWLFDSRLLAYATGLVSLGCIFAAVVTLVIAGMLENEH